jgi:photosystem II reaction center protein PsbP
MSHRFRLALVVALAALWSHSAIAQHAGYLTFTDPAKRFAVDFPKDWKWTIVAGSGEALVTFVQPKAEAAVVVERFRMRQKLAKNEITDVFVQIETDVLKENQPKATSVAGKVIDQSGRRAVVIEYSRPGLGEAERVRQYSYPVNESLYRITCMALTSAFKKYEPTFVNVAESLKSAAEIETKPKTEAKPKS